MPTTTNYIWDEQNYLAEADGTNVVQTVYTHEPQQYGNLVSTRISGTTSYHHFDAIGSTRQLTNAVGTVTDTVIYDVWGNVVTRTGATSFALLWIAEPEYYFDVDTGLIYIRQRTYGPLIARWSAVDPIAFLDTLNRFSYAGNMPIVSIDPTGLLCEPMCCCCVEYLKTQNVTPIRRGIWYGHSFETVIGTSYLESATPGDCTLEWKEKTNRPYTPTMKPNEWNDMVADAVTGPSFDASWGSRKKTCPSTESTVDIDEATTNMFRRPRTLEIRISITSAPDCKCLIRSILIFRTQVLVPTSDRPPKVKIQDFS